SRNSHRRSDVTGVCSSIRQHGSNQTTCRDSPYKLCHMCYSWQRHLVPSCSINWFTILTRKELWRLKDNAKRRAAFSAVRNSLRERNVRSSLRYPAHLQVDLSDERLQFDYPQKAQRWFNERYPPS
ncbi:hypothetical protein AMELA_G00259720, partial [Ameiurus melas]